MSISNALQAGVSGLQANSSAVGRISENIANANTDGYHRRFSQMVTTSTLGTMAAPASAGVRVAQGIDVGSSGTLRSTGRPTDLAIGGDGFFVVTRSPNEVNEANYMLTRAGSFMPDENGNLRNAAGYYLAGFSYDQAGSLGLVDRTQFADLKTVNLGSLSSTGSPTEAMRISGNLPSQQTGLAEPGEPFLSSAEFYTPLGAAERLRFEWQPGATKNQWTLSLSHEDGTQYGKVQADFHDSGPLAGAPRAYSNATTTATAPAGFAFDAVSGTATLTIDNGAAPQVITVSLGAPDSHKGMTQFSGDYSPLKIASDGAQSGVLIRTEIDDRGDVYGVFDNGSRKALYNIPLAEMTNPAGLLAADGNAYLLSRTAGEFALGQAGQGSAGTLTAGALESSNVGVAEELTGLIQMQRAYSSNARVVTTADEMLDETVRLKR